MARSGSSHSAARTVRGRASIRNLVPRTRRGVPTRRLCPLGVPREALAPRGPIRRLVPSFHEEYDLLRSRAEDHGVGVANVGVGHPILVGEVAFPAQWVGAIGS